MRTFQKCIPVLLSGFLQVNLSVPTKMHNSFLISQCEVYCPRKSDNPQEAQAVRQHPALHKEGAQNSL